MKFVIFKKENDQPTLKIGSYESSFKDDSSTNRPHDQAEPMACHIQLPEGMDEDCVIPQWMELEPEQIVVLREAQEAQEEILDEEGNIVQEAREALPALTQTIPAIMGWSLVEDADAKLAKRQDKANKILDDIRALREPLLVEADHSINTLEDEGLDASLLRAWRKSLRLCTDALKKVDGNAKLSCENLVPEEFEFPAKPE